MSERSRTSDDELAAAYGIDPRLMDALPAEPFTLTNFFRLRDRAVDDAGLEDGRSGIEAMMQYARVSRACLDAASGRFLAQGLPVGTVWGSDDIDWDVLVVAHYPNGDAFRALLGDPRYRAAFADRCAAVVEQRVVLSVAIDA